LLVVVINAERDCPPHETLAKLRSTSRKIHVAVYPVGEAAMQRLGNFPHAGEQLDRGPLLTLQSQAGSQWEVFV
jgi:hypothetical protein